MTKTKGRGPLLPPQAILQDRYRINRLHDQGGSATVYLAERLGVDERVPLAVKELSPDAFSLAEFKNEVNVLFTLNHPNLPKVYDFFEEGGRHYLVMDFVQGKTLKLRVLEGGPLGEDQALDYALQVCDIMVYLHERAGRKVLHRDLKPSNLMLTRGGQVKLLDFGIARLPEAKVQENLLYAYTEDYASPEQRANLQTDERSDIYSFGVTLHFLLTGATAGEVTGSREVARIINRCLRRNPAERYQSFQELARDIQACRRARRTRVSRTLWVAAVAVAVAAVLVSAKVIFGPSLYAVGGPDRVEAGSGVTFELGLPAAWSGGLESIVWQVFDTQVQGQPSDVQRGRYFTFRSTDLGVYQVQACLEEQGRRRPLSVVKRVEVYPGLDVPGELLAGQPMSLRAPAVTATGGRQYLWTWDVKGPLTGADASLAPVVVHQTTTEPVLPFTAPVAGAYVAQLSATVKAAGGVDATVAGEPVRLQAVAVVTVVPGRVVNANPSFEESFGSSLAGWTLAHPAHVALDSGRGRKGSHSVRFDPWTGQPASYAVQLVPVEADQAYRLTAWVSGRDLAEGSVLTLEAHFRSAVDETYVRPEETARLSVTGSFAWRQAMLYFRTPPGSSVNLEIYLKFSGRGTVWFDDCALEPID